MKRHIRTMIILGSIALLFAGCGKKADEEAVGETNSSALSAKDFSVTSVDGGSEYALGDFEGKVLILDFWATWCGPCKREIPHFNDLYAQYKDQGLEILGVSLDEGGPSAVNRFVKQTPITYNNAMASREIVEQYGPIQAIPTTFVIDRKGNVQRRFVGYQSLSVFEEVIQSLL